MKKIIPALAGTLFILSGAFAEEKTLSKSIENLTDDFSEILVENSTVLGNQPDAFIGKVFPSIPVHFTAGLSVSGTLIDTGFISDSINDFKSDVNQQLNTKNPSASVNVDFSLPSKLPMPSAANSARIGGIILPFDIGLYGVTTANFLKDITLDDFKADIDYTTFGADFRYNVLQENGLIPEISLGAGYLYSKMGFSLDVSKKFSQTITELNQTYDSTLKGNIDMNISNHVLFAQAQVSKKLLIFTPYAGAKLMFTKTDSDYEWKYATDTSGIPEGISVDVKNSDKSDTTGSFDKTSTQVFGGLGMQLGFFQMALNAAYNFTSQYFSAGIGLNFKM